MEQGLEEDHVNAVPAAKQEKAYILSVVIKLLTIKITASSLGSSQYICTNTAHLYLHIAV